MKVIFENNVGFIGKRSENEVGEESSIEYTKHILFICLSTDGM